MGYELLLRKSKISNDISMVHLWCPELYLSIDAALDVMALDGKNISAMEAIAKGNP